MAARSNETSGLARAPVDTSPLSQSLQHSHEAKANEGLDNGRPRSYVTGDDKASVQRSTSRASTLGQDGNISRGGTLKKKSSLRRKSSLKRSSSVKSFTAGSIHVPIDGGLDRDKFNSVFFTPVPTHGSPTDILVNRFQAWRKFLKDLIAYFREVQLSYDQRGKSLVKVSNVINFTNAPSIFLADGGINDANRMLSDYHRQAILDANKARDIEEEIVVKLGNLRNDLGHKIKEIKSLAGDFKNSVDKEKEATRKAVGALESSITTVEAQPDTGIGKADPYVVRLAAERQIEKQIDEENYLHRAYLNLEGSGRELESIVVGEIQKSYNALAGILKRDADESYNVVEKLRAGPISMPRDHEWTEFVEHDPNFVNPNIPLRNLADVEYPGKHHPAAAEVRVGMLERKSKYLKSYTPGWYVLTPTHLHEFKSADRIHSQPPIMSLYLMDQKLGSYSQPGSTSHKFMLKGRQTGSMHRGHSWVFRAESYETMMAWYEDIKLLTMTTGAERNAFVRNHARSISGHSQKSGSSDGLDEDEADEVPYAATTPAVNQGVKEQLPQRPSPGGRFPSDIQVNRNLHAPRSVSSGSSDGHELIAHRNEPARSALVNREDHHHHHEHEHAHVRVVEPVRQESFTSKTSEPHLMQNQPYESSNEAHALQNPPVESHQSNVVHASQEPIVVMPATTIYAAQTPHTVHSDASSQQLTDAHGNINYPRDQNTPVAAGARPTLGEAARSGSYSDYQDQDQDPGKEVYLSQPSATTDNPQLASTPYSTQPVAGTDRESTLSFDQGISSPGEQRDATHADARPAPVPYAGASESTYLTYTRSTTLHPTDVTYDPEADLIAQTTGISDAALKKHNDAEKIQ